jgi:O-antigen/teichoic acid export membrane protein
MVTTQLFGLGNMLATVTGPRLAESYGRWGDRRFVARLAARTSELQAAAMALPVALAVLAAPAVLVRLLPDYRTGLPPLIWLAPAVVALVLALPGSQYLVAVGRQRRALAAVLVATGLAALGNHVALRGGYGLMGVAAATAAGYVIYFVLVVAASLWIELDRAGRVRYVAMLALVLGPTLASTALLERAWPRAQSDWTIVLAKVAAVSAIWGLSVALGWHHGGWGRELRRDSA